MASFGWAYVNCSDTGSGADGAASGPTGSLQFISGALGHTTGSHNLIYYTASAHGHEPSHLILSGNLTVTGTISASVYRYRDVSIIDATGSTFFGDSIDDVHSRTGSFEIWSRVGSLGSAPTVILTASAYSKQTFVQGFGGSYTNVTSSHHTASTSEYILGITAQETPPNNVYLTIPSPVLYSAGAVLVIKDEKTTPRGLSNITLTRSVTDTYTFDGDSTYILTGTMPAISLYSNGTNWFVF